MRKTFVYECVAENTGRYDFKNKIVLKFHNPATGRSSELRSAKVIEVEGVKEIADQPGQNYFFDKSLLIAVDVSQSMQIEDYTPTRLEAIKQGLRKLAAKHNLCNVGIIQFGANFKHVALSDGETCYSVASIDSISHRMLNGTAIGDAIWFGSVSAKKNTATKLVIIGDGDNTAGHLSAAYAASLAKSKGIKVYTIGVGNTGDVPYGRDYFNRPNMISNTFSDRDFKMVARVTGAEYVWAKDADAVAKALEKFLFGK